MVATKVLNCRIQRVSNLSSSLLIICLCCLPSVTRSAFEDLEVGARPLGVGGAYVGLSDDVNALVYNPAGISQISGLEVTLFYARPFGLREISHGYVALVRPTRLGSLGVGLKSFGGDIYRENTLFFSYGRSLGKRIMLGGSVRHLSLSIERYGSASSMGLDVGLLARISSGLSWGSFVRNVNQPGIGSSREDLPQTLATGLSLRPHPGVIVVFDLYKDIRYSLQVKAGMEYQFLDLVALRAGVQTEPARFTIGLGLLWRSIEVDYALWNHQELGASHHVSLILSRGEKRRTCAFDFTSLFRSVREEKGEKKGKKGKKEEKETVININTATVEELVCLPGIGKKLAERIIRHREEHGDFQTVEDLVAVPGIGEKLLQRIRDRVITSKEDR